MGALFSALSPRTETCDASVEEVAQLLASASNTVCLTGAGISAESGIPTFRDPADGLWKRYDPAQYATIWGFNRQPHLIWHLLRDFLAENDPQPNAGHTALANLQRMGVISCVVTQNVDGLHQVAGSEGVVEFHGDLLTARCSRCGAPAGSSRALLSGPLPPLCATCGGFVKPSATLFGESLPPGAVAAALSAVNKCDVLLVVGTSASVRPASELPRAAAARGATVVEVNTDDTGLTNRVSHRILRGKAGVVLPAVAARVAQLRVAQPGL